MGTRTLWMVLAVVSYGVTFLGAVLGMRLASERIYTGSIFMWGYALSFLLFAVFLLGAIARCWGNATVTLWRLMMLCLGAGLAVVELVLLNYYAGYSMQIEYWMAALPGLVVTALLARALPKRLLRYWLGS